MKKIGKLLGIIFIFSIIFGRVSLFAYVEDDKNVFLETAYLQNVFEQIADSDTELFSDIDYSNVSNARYLYDFDENPIAILYEFEPQGYAIYDFERNTVLEYTKEANHQFYTDSDKRYYYNGILEYYEKSDKGFVNLATGRIFVNSDNKFGRNNFYADNDLKYYEEVMPETFAKDEPVGLKNPTNLYNCNRNSNFSFFYPNLSKDKQDKWPGVCGSVACAIVMAYYDDYKSSLAGSGDFATDWKKTAGSQADYSYGKYLTKELVEHIEPSGNGSFLLNIGLYNYLRNHGITGGCDMGLLTVYQQTKAAINEDSPIIIGLRGHYCVGIGYKNLHKKQIEINTGHGYTEWIDASSVLCTWTIKIYEPFN